MFIFSVTRQECKCVIRCPTMNRILFIILYRKDSAKRLDIKGFPPSLNLRFTRTTNDFGNSPKWRFNISVTYQNLKKEEKNT